MSMRAMLMGGITLWLVGCAGSAMAREEITYPDRPYAHTTVDPITDHQTHRATLANVEDGVLSAACGADGVSLWVYTTAFLGKTGPYIMAYRVDHTDDHGYIRVFYRGDKLVQTLSDTASGNRNNQTLHITGDDALIAKMRAGNVHNLLLRIDNYKNESIYVSFDVSKAKEPLDWVTSVCKVASPAPQPATKRSKR